MGGSDQWGNITSGTEFIRRNLTDAKAYAITSKLLAKSDGKKFGKSEKGNIWLDPNMTSPYQFYQFWLNADDSDLQTFMRYFTLKPRKEIEQIENDLKDDPRAQKALLAEELTTRIHEGKFESVKEVSEIIFNKKLDNEGLKAMKAATLEMVSEEVVSYTVPKGLLSDSLALQNLVTEKAGIFTSLSEFRRAVKGNAISVNKVKVSDASDMITSQNLLQDRFLFIENGKKNKYILCLLYTSPSPRDGLLSRMPSSA